MAHSWASNTNRGKKGRKGSAKLVIASDMMYWTHFKYNLHSKAQNIYLFRNESLKLKFKSKYEKLRRRLTCKTKNCSRHGPIVKIYSQKHDLRLLLAENRRLTDFTQNYRLCCKSSMKSCKQRKRKAVNISRNQDECKGVPVKKSANGSGRGYQKATESVKRPDLEPHVQIQISPIKVKLQLFPINEETRMGLEKDGHNPFLELTLSARKRISSVVRHLNTKWGSSSAVLGQLMLFPYSTKLEQIASCKRWTLNDSAVTAGEVYVDVGSPSIFRLRYGWCSNLLEACAVLETPRHQEEKLDEACDTIENHTNVNEALHLDVDQQKSLDLPTGFVADEPTDVWLHSSVPWDDNLTNLSIGGLLSEISKQGKINGSYTNSVNKSNTQPIGLISDISIGDLLSEASLLGKMSNNNPSMKLGNESSLQPLFLASKDTSVGGFFPEESMLSNKNKLSPWYDDLTTLSIGGLLSEASLQAKACGSPELKEGKSSLQPNTFLLDSSDSLISDQLKARLEMPKASPHETNLSILDAEETCHAFPVRKLQTDGVGSKQFQFPLAAKMNNDNVFPKDFSCQELKTSLLPHCL